MVEWYIIFYVFYIKYVVSATPRELDLGAELLPRLR